MTPEMRAPLAGDGGEGRGNFNSSALAEQTNRSTHAADSRRASIAAGARFRRDWLDAERWAELAKSRGLRLPQWHTAPTPRTLKTAARSLGNLDFQAVFGCSPSRLIELNPAAPLRAFIGWMLEEAADTE